MEDHMTSSDTTGTGSSSVTMVTDSVGTDPDLDRCVLCNRGKVLEQNEVSALQSDSYLRHRIRLLERSRRSLLLQLYQLASASKISSMQHSQRLDQRLHMLREEVRTMTQEKERGEQVWRDRLQRCQRQLKAKEDEMSRQSQYFENFKTQLQHKLSVARDREQSLQNRIYALEKQVLDMTVSAATGMATISAVRITAGTVTHWEEQERLPSMRGEGEGEEEKREDRRRQWQPSVGTEREGGQEVDEGKTENEIQAGRVKDTKQNSNEARLQGFILSLQEDLRVLLEREEDGVTERRRLLEQLQVAQENSHFLGCKVEEMKAELHQLKLSESSLVEEVEVLREENHRLQQIITDAANQASSQSSTAPESTCPGPGTSLPSKTHSHTTATGQVHLTLDEGIAQRHSPAGPPVYHQATAESKQSNKENHSSSAKSGTPPKNSFFHHLDSKTSPILQSLSLTTETLGELGTWCYGGILNLEESPSEESDALREAYRSLGLVEDPKALEVALQHAQGQLQVMAQENTRLKLQLRKEDQEAKAEQGSSREKISTLPTSDSAEDNTILAQDDLVQALNQENRALADRIKKLLAHVELREKEIKREETRLREKISRLEVDRVRLEQENQEQGCLITELTKKTEDDLNTIMELQQKLAQHLEESQVDEELCGSQWQSEYTAAILGHFQQNNLEECVDSLVEHVLKVEEPQSMSSQQPDDLTTTSVHGSQQENQYDPLQNNLQSSLLVSSLTDQVGQLTKSVQNLKMEQEELSGCIKSLREQQGEVALSVQTQTEVKQQLTRSVWGLKEEKDSVSQSLAGLKQEREQLTGTVCGLKDERDQFIRSMSGLKEEKEQLTNSLSGLEREKEKLKESLSSGKEERDQIMQTLQSLQTESDQLSQAVLCLKQERDELTNSLKCQTEQSDKEQSSYTLREDRDKLIKSVSSLRDEKERIELSISCLKEEEEQIMLLLQSLREKRNGHKDTLSCQTQAKRLHSELCQSEARREEAETKAAQATDKVMRLTDVANQMEETRRENDSLITQVKELQNKLTGMVKEKTNALSLKAQIEEQHNILTAQLKAKTVALEELNSEYIALKRGQGSKDDLSTVLISLRTRYNDIRAKVGNQPAVALQSMTVKAAKLSCLVVKCQERNSLLVQMMKAMHRHGCVDSTLTQQVDQLLNMKGKSSPDLTSLTGSSVSPSPTPLSSSTRVSPSRRLSSPEKIINLHEQLQRTLMSSYQSAHRSPERPNKSARKSTTALEKTKTARPKPEAPAEVRSVEVIKTVGQSSLMIGWERPPLDELGCSNGTFVYGYRVFVDGDFHKSVMSSACTKCVLENVNLSVPVHISVQTLGSNGLGSNSVHTTYRTSVSTDQH
ncbi:uncharacterized protein ABDE67_004283 [Symphorus nematophorus]